MGHLIEEYAKSLGVKIGKPILIDHFFPITDDKYITIHSDNKIDSKYYEYFPEVLKLIIPSLSKHGYKIYQIGGPEDPKLLNVNAHFLNLNFKQSSYIIKNSKLHLGIDSLPVHIASAYNIPIVALYSHVYAANAYPYWSDKENIILHEAKLNNNKPSFSYQENPKSIRTIKPEEIAKSIFKLLKIEEELTFKTINIGSYYSVPLIEIVPNFRGNLQDQKDKTIYIRADIHFNDEIIAFWCANYKSKIITDQIIPLELLNQFSSNIEHIYFKLNNNDITNEYFNQVKNLKIKFTICWQDKDTISKIKNHYFDHIVEYDNLKERIEKQKRFNAKFLTNKVIVSNAKVYPSEAHIKLEKTIDSINEVVYDDDMFWKDAEHFYFYE